jgi:4-hydroxy-4-methyl-2-oxoglutarate aldolase
VSTTKRPAEVLPGPDVRGHEPVVPPRIGTPGAAVAPELLARLRACNACDVVDVVGRLYSMDAGIRPLWSPVPRLVGTALTVKAVPGDNLAIHHALGLVRPGDVLVVDWRGYVEGCGTGVLSLIEPIQRGLAGVVCDGAWRDVDDICLLGFPIFGRGLSPYSPPKARFGEVNVPVSCGGVVVEPGDVVVADEGGVAVVPHRHLDDVVAAVPSPVERSRIEDYPTAHLATSAEGRRARLADMFDAQHGLRDA